MLLSEGPTPNYKFNFQVKDESNGGQGSQLPITSATSPQIGVWYHVVGVFDDNANMLRIYINGVQESSATWNGAIGTASLTSTGLVLGRRGKDNISGRDYVNGLIDDVRIYNRALSNDEIKRLYKIGATFKVNTSQNLNNNNSLQKGLVGWWTFDGKDMSGVQAYDRSGNGNRGILTSGPVRTIGKIGQALSFDGSNDYVAVGSASNLNNLTKFTYSVWIKPSADAGTVGHIVTTKDIYDKYFSFYGNSGGSSNKIRSGVGTNGTSADTSTPNNTITPGKWHHVVITYDDTGDRKVRIYINGAEPSSYDAQIAATGTINDDTGTNYAFGQAVGGDSFFMVL
jgi:Concanavalin A-like lectin/glucanases superfamily